jgi:hypothetical protein
MSNHHEEDADDEAGPPERIYIAPHRTDLDVTSVKLLLMLLSLAFTLWATVVAWGVHRVTAQIDDVALDNKIFQKQFNEYVRDTERRVTTTEGNDRTLDAAEKSLDSRLTQMEIEMRRKP